VAGGLRDKRYETWIVSASFALVGLLLVGCFTRGPLAAADPVQVVALAGVGGGALLLALSERYSLSLVVLGLYLGLADGFVKLSFASQNVTVLRDVLLYSIVAGVMARLVIRRTPVVLPPGTVMVLAIVVCVLVQVMNPATESFAHGLQSIRQHVEFVPLFFFGFYLVGTKGGIRVFLTLLVIIGAVNGVVGSYQATLTPEELSRWGPGYEATYSRASRDDARLFVDESGQDRVRPAGLGGDAGFSGAVGGLGAIAAIALILSGAAKRWRWLMILGLVLCGAGVATSNARVAVLAAVVGVTALVLLVASGRTRTRAIAAGVIGVSAFFAVTTLVGSSDGIGERYASITPDRVVATTFEYRAPVLALIPQYAGDFPLGAGLGSVGPAGSRATIQKGLNSESTPTFLLIELGLPGFVLVLGGTAALLLLIVTRVPRLPDLETKILLAGAAAGFVALVSTFIAGIGTAATPNSAYLWAVAGVLVRWLVRPTPTR
jgi:hypothetical protein